mgnify:CR=1 FL=1
MFKYGDYFFDPIRRELVRKDLSRGEPWWNEFPHVPNDAGITKYLQTLQKLPWMTGRRWRFELQNVGGELDGQTTLYCHFLNLDGTAVVITRDIGLDLYTLMVQGEAAFLQVMDAVLSRIGEVVG